MPVKTVAVTGVTGRIGGAVARRMLDEGWHVRGLQRPGSVRDAPSGVERVDYSAEASDVDSLVAALTGVDVAVHAAGVHHGASELMRPGQVYEINTIACVRLLVAARSAGVGKVVLLGSTSSWREDGAYPQDGGDYAGSKWSTERFALGGAGPVTAVLQLGWVIDPTDRVNFESLVPVSGRQVIIGACPVPIVGIADVTDVVVEVARSAMAGRLVLYAGAPTQSELMRYAYALLPDNRTPRLLDLRTPGRAMKFLRSGAEPPTWLTERVPPNADWARAGVSLKPWKSVIDDLLDNQLDFCESGNPTSLPASGDENRPVGRLADDR